MTGSERRPATSRKRLAVILSLLAAVVAAALVGPSVVAPGHSSTALASTSPTCNLSGCAQARAARAGWAQLNWPTNRGWHNWPAGKCNYSGGQYYNDEGDLPSGATYYEYDVNPRYCGQHRDAERIVVNYRTKATWYTPDHYSNFYRIN